MKTREVKTLSRPWISGRANNGRASCPMGTERRWDRSCRQPAITIRDLHNSRRKRSASKPGWSGRLSVCLRSSELDGRHRPLVDALLDAKMSSPGLQSRGQRGSSPYRQPIHRWKIGSERAFGDKIQPSLETEKAARALVTTFPAQLSTANFTCVILRRRSFLYLTEPSPREQESIGGPKHRVGFATKW